MKVKGVNIFEQHVEKIVVAVVAIAVLGALALQFLSETQVQVDGREVPVGQAFRPAEDMANRVKSSVEDSAPQLPEAPEVSIEGVYEERLAKRRSPRPEVLAFDEAARIESAGNGGVDLGGDELFAPFEPPAPTSPVAASYQGAIDPRDAVQIDGLARLLPAQQPFDTSAITVAARFDGLAFREGLDAAPEGRQQMPRAWAREIEIVGVELSRQLRLASDDWGQPEIVPGAPGRSELLALVRSDGIRQGDLQEMLDEARDHRRSIVQPVFYRTVESEPWAPPIEGLDSEALAPTVAPADVPKVERLTRLLTMARRGLEDRNERLDRIRGNAGDRRQPDDSDAGGGRRDGGRREGTPPRRDDDPTGGSAQTPEQRVEAEIAEFEDQIRDLESQLVALGVELEPEQGEDEPREAFDPSSLPPLPPLDQNESLRMWAHDLTGEPGETYRYRLRPIFSNPFFGQKLADGQADLARLPEAPGPWSDWTEPVTLPEMSYYFVTNANAAGAAGVIGAPARASLEVFRFYYGDWRSERITVEPGDELSARIPVPEMPIFNLDVIRDAQGALDGPGDARAGGRDPRGGGRDGGFDGGRDPRDAPPPRRDPPRNENINVPAEPGPTELAFDIGSVLLDVAPQIGEEGVHVVLYKDGEIDVRRPTEDRASSWYRRLREAVKDRGNPAREP